METAIEVEIAGTITYSDSINSILNMNKPTEEIEQKRSSHKVEISINLDSEVLEQLKLLTNDPSRTIENAIKQWLKGEREVNSDLTRTFGRNPPLPPRGEWND